MAGPMLSVSPLYNNCARDALAYLGYDFAATDYDAFVSAHEQFKRVYQKHIGRLRPDLPLNLEVDKFYNVIDKVDLQRSPESRRHYWRISIPESYPHPLEDGTNVKYDLWTPSLEHGIAAVEFGHNKDYFLVKKFMSIRPGDRIVAFTRLKTVGGIGEVVRGYDDDLFRERPPEQDYWDGHYWFRIGVAWEPGEVMHGGTSGAGRPGSSLGMRFLN